MKRLPTIIFAIIFTTSCTTHTRWTDKRRKEFARQCSNTEIVNDLTLTLTGFDYDEIKNVIVRQIHNGQVIDSFYVFPNKNSFDSSRTRYSAHIDKPLFVKDNYQFVIQGHDPFILSDMKMIVWSQFTMYSEGHGCVMGDYKIDGLRFENSANPDFTKK